ncbi:META domain-containing protein [Chitinimonas naiadis]
MKYLLLLTMLVIAGCATSTGGGGSSSTTNSGQTTLLGALSGGPKLVGTRWAWAETTTPSGRLVAPRTGLYLLDFAGDGYVRVTADCNRGSAKYALDGKKLTMGQVATTRMACPPGGQGSRFTADLGRAVQATTADTDLLLSLPAETAVMRFAPLKQNRYVCQGGLKFSLTELPGPDVAIEFDGRYVRAAQTTSASGVIYEAPGLRFQGKGPEAMLDMGELSLRNCKLVANKP